MFTRKPRLQLEKFAINGTKRLLQHNRHEGATALHRRRVQLTEVLRKRVWVVLDVVHDPQRTYRAIARAHEAYTFFATNTTDSQPPIGREPVGTDSVRYRRPDRPRLGRPLF